MDRWPQHLEHHAFRLLPTRWQARLRAAHAGNKAAIRGMVWLTFFVLVAKGVAALKEVAVAYRFGTSAMLEGYLLVFNLATWPASVSMSVMHFVLVPALVRVQHAAPDGGHAWQRQVTTWVWGASVLAGLAVATFLPSLIRSGWLGLTEAGRQAALETLPAMGIVTTLGVVGGWHACQLMSRQRHVNTFLESMPALAILGIVLVAPMAAVDSLLWGTLLGFALQAALLMAIVRAGGMPVAPAASVSRPLDRALLTNFNVLLAAQALMGVGSVIDQIVLAHLPAGELATFGYANRVMALMLTLTSTVVGRALLPVLAGLSPQEGYVVARRWAWLFFGLGMLGMLIVMVSALPMVQLLFQRGAYTAEDAETTASVLAWMVLQLPLYVVNIVWSQWALSRPGHAQAFWWAAVASLLVKWGVVALLIVILNWTANAVALGVAASAAGYFVVLYRFVWKDVCR